MPNPQAPPAKTRLPGNLSEYDTFRPSQKKPQNSIGSRPRSSSRSPAMIASPAPPASQAAITGAIRPGCIPSIAMIAITPKISPKPTLTKASPMRCNMAHLLRAAVWMGEAAGSRPTKGDFMALRGALPSGNVAPPNKGDSP